MAKDKYTELNIPCGSGVEPHKYSHEEAEEYARRLDPPFHKPLKDVQPE